MTAEELKKKKDVVLALMSDPMYRPMRVREIAMFLDIPKARRAELDEVLASLLEEGKISLSKRGKYGKPEKQDIIGVFSANPKGFGFVKVEGQEQDIFVAREFTHGAMNGDTVRISVEPGHRFKSPEGTVLEILKRANDRVVGFYRRVKNYGVVLPDNQHLTEDVYVPQAASMGAVTGHKVVVQITRFPAREGQQPEGRVVEILGHVNDPGTDILSIARAYDLPDRFPDEVMQQAAGIPETVPEEKLAGRRDFTELLTITIDGEDAKDLDDAVSLEELENGRVRLGVHIADVSEYVKERTPLDREALKRGTSVYMADRVIPMLPHALCNGICSLNEGVLRLTLSCMMEIDEKGRITEHEICESCIRSDHRMTYTAVNRIISEQDPELCAQYADIVPMLRKMARTAGLLRTRRNERGYIDFDFPESKVILNTAGKPVEIRAYERNEATRLIEDFMLAVNETVAEEYSWRQIPFLYRIHDKPDPDRIKELSAFVNNFGLVLKTRNGEVHPREIRKLLAGIEGTEAENLISRIVLRSMKQACYSPECAGHFGLAAKYYTHFTSPIRRYPDLQIHRIIKENLRGDYTAARAEHYASILTGVAEQTSRLERRADEAERESVKYKKCEYMEKHIGEEYEGVISGVTRYGIFVELPNTVEGMIRVSSLRDDYYEYDETKWELKGEMTRKCYRLGEKLRVRVADADRLSRTVDFVPAGNKKLREEEE